MRTLPFFTTVEIAHLLAHFAHPLSLILKLSVKSCCRKIKEGFDGTRSSEQKNSSAELLLSYLETFRNQCRYNMEPFDKEKRDI